MPNFMYKDVDINSIVTKGATSIPTTHYNGFPAFTTTTTDYGIIKNELLYQTSSTDIVSNYSIEAISYKTVDSNSPCPIPSWCNGVKFYICSAKGKKGDPGGTGPKGAQGDKGYSGNDGRATGCPPPKATRPKSGGPGGDGGDGGDGGPGGAGGSGGAGVYFYNTSLIPVTGGSSAIIQTTSNMSLNISGLTYSANTGANGGNGKDGDQGAKGGRGNQGSDGGNSCQSPGTAPSGNTGVKGKQGAAGSDGNTGDSGTVSSPNTVIEGKNTKDSKEITIYFFRT